MKFTFSKTIAKCGKIISLCKDDDSWQRVDSDLIHLWIEHQENCIECQNKLKNVTTLLKLE